MGREEVRREEVERGEWARREKRGAKVRGVRREQDWREGEINCDEGRQVGEWSSSSVSCRTILNCPDCVVLRYLCLQL